ncbi:unnamed protein product [Ceratitis capitata]|uniref:(Mediterranean fruit fly) hypothetical protein n=1 Tax=Ceratitis capitata TaxID=7213 RepID=A0A811UVA4_CERCA|nr:unnamed protein product [Ceratitis capitata]
MTLDYLIRQYSINTISLHDVKVRTKPDLSLIQANLTEMGPEKAYCFVLTLWTYIGLHIIRSSNLTTDYNNIASFIENH